MNLTIFEACSALRKQSSKECKLTTWHNPQNKQSLTNFVNKAFKIIYSPTSNSGLISDKHF